MNDGRRGRVGFTLIEILIVISIIGVIAAIAIDQFQRFQLKSKSAEGKINLAAIRTAQTSYYSEFDEFTAAADLDDDLVPQILGYVQVDRTGTRVPPLQDCNVAALAENEVAPCNTAFGRSIF